MFVIFEAMNLNEVTQRKSINKNRKLGTKTTKVLEKKNTKENKRKEYEKLGLKKKPAKSDFMKERKTEFQKEMRSLCQVFSKDQMNKRVS